MNQPKDKEQLKRKVHKTARAFMDEKSSKDSIDLIVSIKEKLSKEELDFVRSERRLSIKEATLDGRESMRDECVELEKNLPMKQCTLCDGTGGFEEESVDSQFCTYCNGTGRIPVAPLASALKKMKL